MPFGHLNFVLRALRLLRPCDPRTDASDHIFVLGIFILLLLLVVVVVVLLLLLLILFVVVVVVAVLLLLVVVGVEVGQVKVMSGSKKYCCKLLEKY